MCPIIISSKGWQEACTINKGGISFTTPLIKESGWKINDRVSLGYIHDAEGATINCILFSKATQREEAYLLSYANKEKKSGGKISCAAACRNTFSALFELPKKVKPVFFDHDYWRAALLLDDEIKWVTEEFSQAGVKKLPNDTVGVYELLGKKGAVLRIGEGVIRVRMLEHLKYYERFKKAEKFRFSKLAEKVDSEILEKVLLAKFELDNGMLPLYNERKK